ncbi:TonB dependent receptor [Gelidibacter algens]|uniref:TonB dependent receptor n=1 Tax=Gelidibacter algens TaxID=49280 RepID=A0A1A7R4F9_9FLAO|nr:TonB-dependent receptor [Gelidibacter algens]OBX27140.1 TonB-dependent receptor [Gelidibacter algens]RAJ28010.1 TonB dependent receptor [Gelidibacter algens]
MLKQIKYMFTITVLTSAVTFAQERTKDTLDPEVVTVVKAYTPTVADAFKIKETPTLDDKTNTTKKEIKYNIFSIPVASTFTPAKGKAETVNKPKSVKLYDNYASLGIGTYTTIFGEVYLNHELGRGENVGGYFTHHSSSGGIEDLLMDDDFIDTKLNVNYSQRLRDLSWTVDAGALYQKYNWYGLPQPYFDATTANTLNGSHTFYGGNVGGKVKFEDLLIKDASARFRRFGDNQGSGENRFIVKASADVPIQDELISTEVTIDYIGGALDRNFYTNEELKYSNINFGIAPTYQLTEDDLTLNLGVNIVYMNNTEAGDSDLYIYPNITATYRLVDELMIAFGGLEGGLKQNSYYDFAQENPFVSPTLFVAPTDQKYNASVGLKGKLSNSIGYSVSGNYLNERNKALYVANPVFIGATEDYQYGNSFGMVYDDVKTISFAGELNVDVNRNFKLGVKAEYFSYNTDTQAEAWNLPDLKGSLFLDYQIDDNWFAGAGLFYVGERKDQFFVSGSLVAPPKETLTLDSYFDANAHVGYRLNEQLSFYLKANNIANQDYERWLNTPVQGIQVLAGATYQFDF